MNRWSPPKQSAILLLCTDEAASAVVREGLRAGPYRIAEVTDVQGGLEAYERHRPDLVLVHVGNSNRQRLDLCRRLRGHATSGPVPVVLLAGAKDLDVVRLGHQAGVTDLIALPTAPGLLAQRVEYVLSESAEHRRLFRTVARMKEAQRFARIGTWEWSLTTRTLEFSEEAERILGLTSKGANVTVDTLLRNVPLADRPRVRAWLDEVSQGGLESTIEHRVMLSDAVERVVRQHAAVSHEVAGAPPRISVVISDISEWRRAEERSRYQANHDPVTGLDNLDRFLQRLEEATWLAQRYGGQFAVLYLGVANFGRIHESLGHRYGDGVLKGVAERLQSGLRKTDWVCNVKSEVRYPRLARLDGAEFAVLLQPVDQIEGIARVASRVVQTFSEPIVWGGQELFLDTHVGIALFPGDGGQAEGLLQRAQAAMRRAQADGRSEPYFVTDRMTDEAAERLALESSLRHAIDRDQLEPHYQPKVDIATGRIAGMEALLRWRHPELGDISPVQFIPVAEESGAIVSIGEWVLRAACRQARQWQDAGHRPFPVAVNVSVEQFRRSNIVETVARVIEETGAPASTVELELTESGLMDDIERNLGLLRELKELGVLLAVDDFGTGYSSLGYVRRLPIDVIKIDRSFITDLTCDPDADAIVTTIVNMARSLDLKVVAEGVETEQQLDFLRTLGCDEYQGFLFSRARSAASATELLEREGGLAGAA